jgi:hypothetical protein
MLEKSIIYPKVIVYHNLLKDTDKIIDLIKSNKFSNKWQDWSPKGNIMIIDDFGQFDIIESEEEKYEKEIFQNIKKAFQISSKDFIEQYKDSLGWPQFINSWDIEDNNWIKSGISFLKYDPTEKIQDKLYKEKPFAMEYHTDTHEFDLESPGNKFIITVTMYLNDDYEGGEISFLDEVNNKIINYKPEKGDITIFPSGSPYYHGVTKIFKNERYLLRMFWFWNYEGSNDWHLNKNKYGEEKWKIIEKKRIEKEYNSGNYHRFVVYPNEKIDLSKIISKPFYAKKNAIQFKRKNNNE